MERISKIKQNTFFYLGFGILVLVFFYQFFLKGLLPIPSDTIIGLYHPFRDLYSKTNPNGIAYKNFLITDPVRQEYPWRYISIDQLSHYSLPLWNPYSFSGVPLLGNMQSAPVYPLNILFIILPFSYAWSMLIVLQPVLAGIFLFLYLRNKKISILGSILGSVSFSFSGFFIAWLEWGTILHTALWLPLLLFCIDKIFESRQKKTLLIWSSLFIFSFASSFMAGHLQTFFYETILVIGYIIYHFWEEKSFTNSVSLLICALFIVLITAIQWVPLFMFISQSARSIDQVDWHQAGWFIPWQHLIQFIVPDFFGNPTTLNYWGVWNYGELIGYISILPLLMVMLSIFFIRSRIVFFYMGVLCFGLLFALPTPLSMLPFSLQIPFLSTAQPTRLLFLIDFSLSVLAAYGIDYYYKNPKKIVIPFVILLSVFFGIWSVSILGSKFFALSSEQISIVKRNIIFPSIIFFVTSVILFLGIFVKKQKVVLFLLVIAICVTTIDLVRFGWKFTPFTSPLYLFPKTKTIDFLQKNIGNNRFMTTDSQIMPPNFSAMYKLQSIEGYDPLYIQRYGELIAALQRKKADITPPFGFNRIITPHDPNSPFINLLGVKYILSLTDITSPNLTKVFQEGKTRIYENKNLLPRVFFVKQVHVVHSKQDGIAALFDNQNKLASFSTIEDKKETMSDQTYSIGKASIISYLPNSIRIKTDNQKEGFLVLTDIYYPSWKARLDDETDKKMLPIYITDFTFRGVKIPAGEHVVEFYNTLF